MLKVSLPIIPFYTLPKKKWEVDQERKERIEFDSDSSTEEEDPPTNSQEKKKSHRLTLNHNDSFDSLDELDSIGGKMDDVEKDVRESVKSIEDANFGFSTKGPVTATKMVHYNINAIGTGKDSPRPGGEHIEVPLKLAEMYEDPSSEKPIHFFKVGPFYYVWRHLKAWKERVKKRRMHYMIKHYYLKIMKHNEAIKAKREEEMMKKE